MAQPNDRPPFSTRAKRWFYAFFFACLVGATIFALPGALTLFGIGSTAAATVAAVCAALKLNFLIGTFGPLVTLSIAAAIAPALTIVYGVFKGIGEVISNIVGWFRPKQENYDPSGENPSHAAQREQRVVAVSPLSHSNDMDDFDDEHDLERSRSMSHIG